VEEINDFGKGVAGSYRLTEKGSEVFSRNPVKLPHEEQSLRADEIRGRITTGISTTVRTTNVLKYSIFKILKISDFLFKDIKITIKPGNNIDADAMRVIATG